MLRRSISHILIAAAFAPFATGVAASQPVDSLVRAAIDSHPTFEAARFAISRAEARSRSALAWEAPRVGLEISMLPPLNPNPFAKGETMLMVEQEIPLFGQNRKMARAMALEAEVGENRIAASRLRLRSAVEDAYWKLWLIDRRVDLNQESRVLAEVLYRDAESRYTVDRAAQPDLYTIAIEIERLDAEMKTLAAERREGEATVNILAGRPLEDSVMMADALPERPLPSLDSLVALVEAHPALEEMAAMARMKNAEAEATEAMLDPMLMVRGGVSIMPEGHPVREAMLEEVLQAHSTEMHVEYFGLTLGAMISIPLAPWSRSGPEGAADVARFEASAALAERNGMIREMAAAVAAAHARAAQARIMIDYYRDKQIPLLEQSLEAQRIAYSTGRRPFADLIETYRMIVMARMEIAMKRMEYAMALTMIREMTGWDGEG